jgi:RimJ/RimL family protein N-acetyltransferase
MNARSSDDSYAYRPSAGRAISCVSPHDAQIAIGPVLPEDLGILFTWLNDVQSAGSDFSYRPVDCVSYKEWLDRQTQASSQILFMIRQLAQSRAIGFVIFKNLQPVYRAAEIGIRIGHEADRGNGYGTRATCLALDYAWRTLNLRRVSLNVFVENKRAIAAYRKAGFSEEGVMRDAAFTDGIWHDVTVMGAINPYG